MLAVSATLSRRVPQPLIASAGADIDVTEGHEVCSALPRPAMCRQSISLKWKSSRMADLRTLAAQVTVEGTGGAAD